MNGSGIMNRLFIYMYILIFDAYLCYVLGCCWLELVGFGWTWLELVGVAWRWLAMVGFSLF